MVKNCGLCGKPLDENDFCTNAGMCAAWRYGILVEEPPPEKFPRRIVLGEGLWHHGESDHLVPDRHRSTTRRIIVPISVVLEDMLHLPDCPRYRLVLERVDSESSEA